MPGCSRDAARPMGSSSRSRSDREHRGVGIREAGHCRRGNAAGRESGNAGMGWEGSLQAGAHRHRHEHA